MTEKAIRMAAATERRAAMRFGIQQEVLYKILDQRIAAPESGAGITLDISSGGVLFETEQRLRLGKRVELAMNWPVPLEGGCLLKFVAVGRIVRAEDNRAAMVIEQYEFRTRRSKDAVAIDPQTLAQARVNYY